MFWLKNVVYIRFKFTFWEIDFWRKRFSKIFTPKKSWPGQDPSARSFASTVESTTQKNNREAVLNMFPRLREHKNIIGTFYDDFEEIGFRRFFGSENFSESGKFDTPPHYRFHTSSSMTSMGLAGPKDHREIMWKHISETVGRIKTLWACYLFILWKSIFEKFSTPKKSWDRDFAFCPSLA